MVKSPANSYEVHIPPPLQALSGKNHIAGCEDARSDSIAELGILDLP